MTGGVPISYPGAAALAVPDAAVTSPLIHYAQSKLCNIYFVRELARRLAGTHITVNAFNPGLMLDSQFHKKALPWNTNPTPHSVPVAVSGRQLAELVIDEKWRDLNGKYVNRGVEEPSSELSRNDENAKELWETSCRLAGLDKSI
jgi:NAD(P)-dependent dehydrogenase (short-subunit alcohol dehydrogenase family)